MIEIVTGADALTTPTLLVAFATSW